jgi:acyl-CoA hydrolase
VLAAHPEHCNDVHFITTFVPGINCFDLSMLGPGARFSTFLPHPSLRQALVDGRLDLIDRAYSEVPEWLDAQQIDLALVQASAEVIDDRFNLGPMVEFTPIVVPRSNSCVAVLNRRTPSLPGSASLDATLFDLVLESDTPLPSYRDPGIERPYQRISQSVAGLIPNGAVLQIGLGQAPAATLAALSNHNDLRFHTGMISDPLIRLVNSGAVANGPSVITAVAVGTESFYANLERHPEFRYIPVTETHSRAVLSSLQRFHAINTALEVDLRGNVNSMFLGGRRVSGRGGLPDFVEAAHDCSNGASIIVMPSVTPDGKRSRIVRSLEVEPTLPGVTVDIIVTEQGTADLRGLDGSRRAAAILQIADPRNRKAI